MIAILTENFGGKWPFWLSPRQAMVVPVAPLYNDYAREVVNVMKTGGFCVEADVDNGNTMNKKVRNAQLAQFNELATERIIKSEEHGWSEKVEEEAEKSKSS